METIALGTPVINLYGAHGFITDILKADGRQFTLGAGRMDRVREELEITFDNHISIVPENIAAPWIRSGAAARLDPLPVEQIEVKRQAARQHEADQRAEQLRKSAERDARAAAFKIEARTKTPADAKAVIVAELIEDQSDIMSDYWGSTTTRTVILAFSTHTRDLFPELRKAARNFAPASYLADAPAQAEHREKYSMGSGFFLKHGTTHGTGWRIKKYRLYQGADSVPVGEWSLAPLVSVPVEIPAVAHAAIEAGTVTIEQHIHTKLGFAMWIVVLGERVDAEIFDTLLQRAKASKGWYSRKWGTTPAGFAFKAQAAAEAFAASIGGTMPPATPPEGTRAASKSAEPAHIKASPASKMRAAADALQSAIDDKFGHRLANTPKRQRQAAEARLEGARLERTQQGLRLLADHIETATVPEPLRGVTTKAAVYELARSHIDRSRCGYYDAGIDTNTPALDTPAARTLWAMLTGPTEAERKAADLREQLEKLQFANIPDYFPTPAELAYRMVTLAEVAAGHRILEPSAGSGNILRALNAYLTITLKQRSSAVECIAVERHPGLTKILQADPVAQQVISADFLECGEELGTFDRILMNPPFSGGADIKHIRHAATMLRPGGLLVAICANGPRQIEHLQPLCDHWEALPAGSFKAAGTSVNTALIVIRA